MVGNRHLWAVCCGVASVVRLPRLWSVRELHVACVIPILKCRQSYAELLNFLQITRQAMDSGLSSGFYLCW